MLRGHFCKNAKSTSQSFLTNTFFARVVEGIDRFHLMFGPFLMFFSTVLFCV